MLHTVEVDQSTKIEQSGPTILAFANGISHAILIPSRVKRAGFHTLKAEGKSKVEAMLILFSAGLFLLLAHYLDQVREVVIDVEYPGKDRDIKAILLRYFRRRFKQFDADKIVFRLITKKSPADKKARDVRLGKDKEYWKVTVEELLDVIT